jgi:MFS family permease
MYGVTRATMTVISVAAAGFLLWLGDRVLDPNGSRPSTWAYWGWLGLCAAAGLALALAQLLGGWTKWGWPRVSGSVFLVGFLPALVVGAWIASTFDPSESWLQRHTSNWSDDIGVDGFVNDVGGSILHVAAIAVIVGLVLGFSLDTSGPRVRRGAVTDQERRAPVVPEGPSVAGAGYAEQAVPEQPGETRDETGEARVVREDGSETGVRQDQEPARGETAVIPPEETPPRRSE